MMIYKYTDFAVICRMNGRKCTTQRILTPENFPNPAGGTFGTIKNIELRINGFCNNC